MIKTFDGVELFHKRFNQLIAKYPADSLSPREVILTLPVSGDLNKLAASVNAKITSAIFKKAENAVKLQSTQKRSVPFDGKKYGEELTKVVTDLFS